MSRTLSWAAVICALLSVALGAVLNGVICALLSWVLSTVSSAVIFTLLGNILHDAPGVIISDLLFFHRRQIFSATLNLALRALLLTAISLSSGTITL